MGTISDYIVSSFNTFRESHKNYLETFNVVYSPSQSEIHFTFWAYDLLDQDLDFTEDYYQRMQDTFRDWLEKHARVIVADCNTAIVLIEYKQVFRNVSEFLCKQIFEPYNDQIQHTVVRLLKKSI